MTVMYDVAGVFPHDRLGELPGGTTVLVSGPPKIGKQRLVLSLLARAESCDEEALFVTTKGNVSDHVAEYAALSRSDRPSSLSVVDASSTDDPGRMEAIPPDRLATVGMPTDLTGIGIEIAEYLRGFVDESVPVRVGFDQISPLLQYLSTEQVSRFVDVLTGRFSAAGYLSAFTIDSAAHDERVRSVFTHEFDVLVELRRDGTGTREIRILGAPGVTEAWIPFPRE